MIKGLHEKVMFEDVDIRGQVVENKGTAKSLRLEFEEYQRGQSTWNIESKHDMK